MYFELESHELNYMNRNKKNGGGVASYVDRNFKDQMTSVVDNILKCISINIDLLNLLNKEFINTMYSMSLYPKITSPSRITTQGDR